MKAAVKDFLVRRPRLFQLALDLRRLAIGPGPSLRAARSFLRQTRSRGFQPRSILDVGAHLGEWARMARSVFTGADVCLLEPLVEMKPFLERFCRDHPGSRYLQVGAAAESGERPLAVWPDTAGSSFLPSAVPLGSAGGQRTVPTATIDSLILDQRVPMPDLVKVDVQGFELEVLRGATRCLGHCELLVVEVSLFRFLPGQPVFDEVVRFMAERDYVVYDLLNPTARPFDGALAQLDVCFVRRDGLFRSSPSWS